MIFQTILGNSSNDSRLLGLAKMEFEAKKENIKGNPFILRNWSYFKLKEYILYKAKKYGIVVVVEGEKKTKKRKNEEQK